ncbi:CASP-like protein 1C1 [Prunus avium]|uniref:CASP-like protein n=1 Tax=Prunus avium TaxID=42229 RepID=A0A6P5TJM7_PRUAV|nr:CASP-like protein 1C1 [Prunus avium]
MGNTKRLCTLLLRLMAVAATLSAAIVMVTSHERSNILGLSFEAKYNHTPAFRYFVIANAIVTAYGFLVLFLPSKSQLWRLVVALDLVLTMLLTSGISAALAIGSVGRHGNSYAGWLPICGQVPKYCDQVKGALIASFVGLIIYVVLLLYAIHNALDPLFLHKT